ncbi:transporter substrate-binding domain-containing protein [Aquipseudomonas campi]|uniref:Transporter substrate-binding domain-containing protein n=1 Tax=Aquipseudomonas campi TaxID=2731681 RepID=A0A6M8FH96_9GAMM|nr:transporter substrate-binding domain-containing protein [Pseudomonas campi]QKE64117.1 transporter substrate-binding domain-containing protein [Pseudomonas campi]
MLLLCLLQAQPVWAEQLLLATGEFPPYVGEALPGQGLSSQIVRAAFQAAGYQTTLFFMPWRRAAAQTAAGQYAASFPWAMNDERQQQFLYSQPLYQDQIRFFARLDGTSVDERNWQGMRLCIPDGWDIGQLQQQIERFRLQLERPSDMLNCMRMIDAGRVDLTAVNRMVGQNLLDGLQLQHRIGPVGSVIATDLNFLIVSRKHPQARELIANFDEGLRVIRSNGVYSQILQQSANQKP